MSSMTQSITNTTIIIVLSTTIPLVILIIVLVILILCYRRRHITIWINKKNTSDRLQQIILSNSSSFLESQYLEKPVCISHRQLSQPRTETIIYRRLRAPSTPAIYTAFEPNKSSNTRVRCPIVRSTSLNSDFPHNLQTPVRKVTSPFVEAIATHRLELFHRVTNKSMNNPILTTTSNLSQTSGLSSIRSNTSQTVLLFSQRTEF